MPSKNYEDTGTLFPFSLFLFIIPPLFLSIAFSLKLVESPKSIVFLLVPFDFFNLLTFYFMTLFVWLFFIYSFVWSPSSSIFYSLSSMFFLLFPPITFLLGVLNSIFFYFYFLLLLFSSPIDRFSSYFIFGRDAV